MKWYVRLLIFCGIVIACIMVIRMTGLSDYVSFSAIKQHMKEFKGAVQQNYLSSVLIYIGAVIAASAASLPIILPLALLAGYLFGAIPGALYATLGSLIGVTIAFLMLRHVLGSMVQRKYGDRLAPFNKKMEEYGIQYFLVLHYLAVVPYFVINTLASISRISVPRFMIMTIIGSFPVNLIYAFAGRELGSISSIADIFSPAVMLACALLILLALMPMILKRFQHKIDE